MLANVRMENLEKIGNVKTAINLAKHVRIVLIIVFLVMMDIIQKVTNVWRHALMVNTEDN